MAPQGTPPWETPEWRAKLSDVLGDVLHFYAPNITDEQADQIMTFVLGLVVGMVAAKAAKV